MVRRLPDDPDKRRLQYFKRLYQHKEHWHALMEDRGMDDVIKTPEGEDIFLGDLMVGLSLLPNRQRQAFELICLQGFTETAARDRLLPNSKSSTPVQQYADSGLVRMVHAYDCRQQGVWPPTDLPNPKKKSKKRSLLMAVLHPIVRTGLEKTRKEILVQIEGLKVALAQVDELLGGAPKTEPAPTVPAPNPKPDPNQKPELAQMAKELAKTG